MLPAYLQCFNVKMSHLLSVFPYPRDIDLMRARSRNVHSLIRARSPRGSGDCSREKLTLLRRAACDFLFLLCNLLCLVRHMVPDMYSYGVVNVFHASQISAGTAPTHAYAILMIFLSTMGVGACSLFQIAAWCWKTSLRSARDFDVWNLGFHVSCAFSAV